MQSKIRLKTWFLGVFLLGIIIACNDDDDEIFISEPLIDVQIFNIDSLTKVNDSLTIVTDSLMVLTDTLGILSDSSTVLSDSISALNALIDEGQIDLMDELDLLTGVLENFSEIENLLGKNDSTLTVASAELTSIASIIESGNLHVSRIENTWNGRSRSFEDSSTVFQFPLNMNSDSVAFSIFIEDMEFDLSLAYQRTQVLDVKERIKLRAFEILIRSHTFDSAQLECRTSSCIDNGTLVKLYF